ncbi:efflux RND transporter periplasmic adaptor subunit [Pseudaeromonas sharmana]|uniref:Efflux RND transporter periplasmic adaptor subunit n=1 Tax=Pseudaeromonas sharmana TaxID=328412 RepID=A0ABV8CLN6_9GAMM
MSDTLLQRRALAGGGWLLLAFVAGGILVWGANRTGLMPGVETDTGPIATTAPARKVLYYRNPMGQADTSPVPKKDEMGMDYIPVYADEAAAPAAMPGQRKVLYYRNPMGQPDISPVPKQDEMGMDYIPVYADDADPARVTLSPQRIQLLGVTTAPATAEPLWLKVRANGRFAVDERRQVTVTAKYAGWVEKLPVNTTGQTVTAGQTLLETYSPELIAAQQEYLIARDNQGRLPLQTAPAGGRRMTLTEGALQRLRFLDVPERVVQQLAQRGTVLRTLPLAAPLSGIVLQKSVMQGMRFNAGDPLYTLADLSRIWLLAEVYEQDLAAVRVGQSVAVQVNAYPGEAFTGQVAFVYPTLNANTRTVPVRIELDNPALRLKPEMFATVTLQVALETPALPSVPESALIDSGRRQLVLVAQGAGRFAPREVVVAGRGETARGERRVQIRAGLLPDEQVVTRANFLLDSESNLRAALGALQPAASAAQHGGQ